MRNSKVRSRIAAGKLRLRIRDLRNLGARTEQDVYKRQEYRQCAALCRALCAEGLYELTCKVRTPAFLLVFEIDVDVCAR